MAVTAKDTQSLKMDLRSAGEHLKDSAVQFQPLQAVDWLH